MIHKMGMGFSPEIKRGRLEGNLQIQNVEDNEQDGDDLPCEFGGFE
jgi:hypothetical protein